MLRQAPAPISCRAIPVWFPAWTGAQMDAGLPAAVMIASYVFGICREAPVGWEVNRPGWSMPWWGPPMARWMPAPVKVGWYWYGERRMATTFGISSMLGLSPPSAGPRTVMGW